MADNVAITAGSGTTIVTDEVVGTGHIQVVKLAIATDGSGTLVPSDGTDGLLVNLGANNDVVVSATNLDVRDLTATDVVTVTGGAGQAADVKVTLDSETVVLAAGTNNIGDVDVLSLPAIPAGTNNIGDVDVLTVPAPLSTTGGGTEATALRVTLANDSTGVVSVDDNGSSLTVDGTVTANLAAGTNNIGDVDVLSIAAGTNAIGNVGIIPRTTGGLTTYHLVSANTTNATVVKASAGQLFGWYIYNNNAAMRKVAFHNTASTPTAGASIFFTINVPAGAAANVFSETGIAFGTGIAITTVTDVTDAGTTAVGTSDLTINLFYS